MTQNRYGVLVSICLLLVLTAGFFVAAKAVLDKVHNSVASAVATASPTVIVYPTATASASNMATAAPTHTSQSSTPASEMATATPGPQNAQVVMNISPSATNPMTSIPSDTAQVFCLAKLPGVSAGTPLLFRFQRLSTPGDYYSQPETATGSTKFAFIYGPLEPGQWRCLVEANGNMVGTALFTITK